MAPSTVDIERAERALKRAIFKRDAFSRKIQFLCDLAEKVERNEDIVPLFHARKKDLESIIKSFHVEQDNILDLLIELGRDQEYETDHTSVETHISEQYYFIIAIADSILPNESSSSCLPKNEKLHIQLPKIQLPTFDGDLLRWCVFRDTFKSLVHDNTNLSNIERFHYLLSVVSGSASSVVRSVPLSETNYMVAWNALNERFDNTRLIMNAHLDKLFNFPPLKSSSLNELKLFLDTFQENINALAKFHVPDKVGYLLFYVASRVLDSDTKCLFETEHKSNVIPIVDDLMRFIKTRCHALQNSASLSAPSSSFKVKSSSIMKRNTSLTQNSFVVASTESSKHCLICKKPHYIYKCEKLIQLVPSKHLKVVKSHRLCTNCLSALHTSSACTSKYSCRHCSARHHSLLHLEQNDSKPATDKAINNQIKSTASIDSSASPLDSSETAFVGTVNSVNLNVLGTALIRIRDQCGHWIPVRALIDSGSQVSAITQTCASQLGLTRRQNNVTIVGLSQSPVIQTKGCVTCKIVPRTLPSPELTCEPIILSKITGSIPSVFLSPRIRSTYTDVPFADPSFDRPGRIDFLLGADLYNRIFVNGYQVRHFVGLPSAFETTLGWIFMGTASYASTPPSRVCLKISLEPSLNQLLHRFWECEEPVVPAIPFTEEEKCEEIFRQTTIRDNTGRYSVSFPFKMDPSVLGDSRTMAMSRFYNLERKLQGEPNVYAEYRLFMHEYLTLGHMKIATTPAKYIIPHHAVVKYSNDKIKLRVVFDASARTSSGVSLNDILFIGPKLQCDIMNLLICCRVHKYMFTADISKMYRQINVVPSECEYQHILWRDDPSKPLMEYSLSTVTYGIASSPFQAIRVLHQLEEDDGYQYPAARKILSTQTYVDDIITGAETVNETIVLQLQVTQLLAQGGLELKKWASNCSEVLQNVPIEDRVKELSFDPKDNCSVKILGLYWDPVADVFSYRSEPFTSIPTKRSVLSAIAKIYDPLGTLAPITFWAKCFMQVLWKGGYDWDQPISEDLSCSWKKFASELPCVSLVKIQRHIPMKQSSCAQLLGFSDASLKGFSAVVYIRLEYTSMPPTVHLVTAKSKVAPLKSGRSDETLTIPRLELCGALLLAQTLHRVLQNLGSMINLSGIHAWTDSTIVLSWLTAPQTQFKIFVTNRLQKISELLPSCQWHHVTTLQNPADCVSRGMYPNETLSHQVYWNGPEFLKQSVTCWASLKFNAVPCDQLPECKSNVEAVHIATLPSIDITWLERFSTLTRLQRTLVQMRRFIARVRGLHVYSGFIRYEELEDALKVLAKITQFHVFHDLFIRLSSNSDTVIPPALARLAPFIDTDGLIRVGGRIRNSNETEDFKCPILLPKICVLSTLLIRHYHIQHLHAGPQLISSLLSARFWIISSRSVIRHIIFKCVICARQRASKPTPIMGDLPKSRTCPSRPFSNVGIDYAGPLLIKEGKRRNARSTKCYLAIFICMAVKAIHIEVVSDVSTCAFIAALHRFVSRRGVPLNIYSDCGTNFQGADAVLRSLIRDPVAQDLFSNSVSCQWHFNPPAAPHFGGLWEAAVKSAKFHLKRVIGKQILTFEEMVTFTHRVEAVLNSRPITPQSTDPKDLRALSPGHFLIGCPLVALPEPDLTSSPVNRLTRWQLLNQFSQSFWKRWSSEYLTTLQIRAKWYRRETNVAVGDLVLMRRPNVPPTVWKMARVEAIHPGEDGVVRVVTVRTQDGTYKRPVVQLAILPVTDNP